MEVVRIYGTVEENGRIQLTGLPFEPGQTVEILVLAEELAPTEVKRKTIAHLLKSDAIGMWADRDDIGDSVEFARRLRERAQTRDWSSDDPG